MTAASMLCLLLLLAVQSAGAQTPQAVPGRAPTDLVNTQEPVRGDKANDAKPGQAPAPVKVEPASGTKPAAKPVSKKTATKKTTSKKTASKKPGKAPEAAAKAKKAYEPAEGTKAKPAPVKPAAKAKPKAAAKKPVAAGADASKAAPGTPAAAPPPQPGERNLLGMRQADARYQEGVELERRGDLRAAVAAYQQAGESGHALAQKKLGDFYGTGNDVIERDYETSLRWYERARQQGVDTPKPFSYPGVRR